MPSSQNLPTLKIFLDIYIDDFSTYRNIYYSLGGIYLQFGNMALDFKKTIKNYFLIGFIPFGASFNDFIKPVLQEIKRLENGLVIKTLLGRVGCITADLPQGNNLAGIKWLSANYGCRTCNVPKNQYIDLNYNYIQNARYYQQMEEWFVEIESQGLKADMKWLAVKYRLAILMLFILQQFLKPHHIKTETLSNWHTNQNSALSKLCACWAVEANVLKLAFSLTMTENRYKELYKALKSEHEILIHNKWNNNKVKNAGLSKNLDIKHSFFQDLHKAFANYLNFRAALSYRNLEFYDSIMYTVLESNRNPIWLKFHIGDVVELSEETEGIAYAKIELIFWHKANNNQYYAFFGSIAFRQQINLIQY
ncbi:hypothetical protein F8M41_006247 [Gigaspora margarita]|uniref:Uncharacterized protein n=1 Tax=Gigaspora margarita TaxID=4874 RepID=A0A8H4AWU9_GIGMA|nr:hypothetical protein F8M41_006247 [Gigaspora margarita]